MPFTFDFANLIPILPEIAILVLASTVLVVDLYLKEEQKGINHVTTIVGLLIAIGLTGVVGGGERQVVFDGSRSWFQVQRLAESYHCLLVVPAGGIDIAEVVVDLRRVGSQCQSCLKGPLGQL